MVEDFPGPFDLLAESAGKVVADAWTTAMLSLWNGGLWVLQVVLRLVDGLLTPDLSPAGPGAAIYGTTFWLAGALVLVMLMVQLGVTAFRRDGKSLATALVGLAKFVVVWAAWLGYGTAVVAACGAISRALMRSLLQVDRWAAWEPFAELKVEDLTDGAVATVLGLLGLLLWLAAVGHALVMVTRAGALIVLAALTPAAAAGLVADAGRPWFWKSLRWFHAAAFTPVLMVLLLGVGVQMTSGVAYGRAGTAQQAVGTALPGVLLILISCFAPLALFKLLAFVDPTTNSGAAFRAGLTATGGVQGLLTGSTGNSSGGGGRGGAGTAAADGRSSGEATSDEATASRFTQAEAGLAGRFGGPGAALAAGLDLARRTAGTAAAVGSDLTNQMGVGHPSYHFTPASSSPTAGDGSRHSTPAASDGDDTETSGADEQAQPPQGSPLPDTPATDGTATTAPVVGARSAPAAAPAGADRTPSGRSTPTPRSGSGQDGGGTATPPPARAGGVEGAAGGVPVVPA